MNTSPAADTPKHDVRSKLLYLKRWPDFSREYDVSRVGDLARICALLSRKPTVGFLVHRSVDVPSYEVEDMLEQLLATDCIAVFQSDAASPPSPLAQQPPVLAAAAVPSSKAVSAIEQDGTAGETTPSPQTLPAQSFLKRLWGKLLSD